MSIFFEEYRAFKRCDMIFGPLDQLPMLLCNTCTIILAVQMSQNGEITNGLSTYPKINFFLHLLYSRN